MLQVVGRVNSYRQRLQELGAQRRELDREREQLNDVLHFLHREIFGCEVHLKMVENDLSGASRVLKVRRIATQQYDNAAEVLKQALLEDAEEYFPRRFSVPLFGVLELFGLLDDVIDFPPLEELLPLELDELPLPLDECSR